jgi:hypothetical protein
MKAVAARPHIKRIEAATGRIAALARPKKAMSMTTRLVTGNGDVVGTKSGWEPGLKPGAVIKHLGTGYEIVEVRYPDFTAGESEAVLVLKTV